MFPLFSVLSIFIIVDYFNILVYMAFSYFMINLTKVSQTS